MNWTTNNITPNVPDSNTSIGYKKPTGIILNPTCDSTVIVV